MCVSSNVLKEIHMFTDKVHKCGTYPSLSRRVLYQLTYSAHIRMYMYGYTLLYIYTCVCVSAQDSMYVHVYVGV